MAEKTLNASKSNDLPRLKKKSVEMNLKRYQDYLLYSLEEFNQLKQMYQDDDLTEETEGNYPSKSKK